MKKISAIFPLLFLISLMISCSNSDNGAPDLETDVEVIGIWDLTEVNVSAAQDIDMDGTASTNLMNELDCISGTILIDGDNVWTFEQTGISITAITGGQYFAQCSGNDITGTGAWSANGDQITFQGSAFLGTLTVDGGQLTNSFSGYRIIKTLGDDLPGIQNYVYVRRE